MASVFPASIDTFANPVFTKVNGVDVVSAAHVNDLQDAVKAVEEVIAGVGKPLNMASNNYIADDSSFKAMIEALDAAIGTFSTDLDDHINYVLVTDPAQHHANVIAVTAIGNLSSTRVQSALEEHQTDLNNIMSGGTVNGITLDDRYIGKVGSQIAQGPLTVTNNLTVNGNATLGNATGDTTAVAGVLSVGAASSFADDATFSSNILVQSGQKIAEDGETAYSYILFESDRIELYSHRDFVFRLDADDAVDGNPDAGEFQIKNGLNATVLTVDEDGNLTSSGEVNAGEVSAATQLSVGTLVATQDKLDLDEDLLHLQLDKNNSSLTARFVVTMDGDTGNNLASADLLLNLNENSTLITGLHVLKSGIQETGYFGLKVMSSNAGGVFFGGGVNFKHQLTNSPSSITLTPDGSSVNYSNLSVVDMNEYGFFFEFDTPNIGASKVFGTYVTVGN